MTIGPAFPCPVGSIYGQQRRVKLVNIFVALGGLGWWVAPWVSGWMGGREEEGEGTHLHFPDWESQGGETTHSLWNPGRSLGWIVDVFLRSTQPPSIFCIWRPLMLPSNGRCGKGEKDWGPSGRSELFWDSWPWVAIIMKIVLCYSCSLCVGGDMK